MAYFHYRCGDRITLTNDNCTAIRDNSDFDHGLVLTAEPLLNDVLFEIKIDRKVNSWSGSLEIGVIECDPLHFDFPPCASKLQSGSWIMSASSFCKNGVSAIEGYGADLDKLNQDDRVGLMRTSEGDLIFFINGESQGVAAEGLPSIVYGIVDLYGKCVQVTITSPALREHNNDDCLSGSSVLAIDNDILNVTLGGDLSELSLSSSNSLDIRMDMNASLSLPEEVPRVDKLRFHDRSGTLVKLSNNGRTAERRYPLDEFNNGVVMTYRPLRDNELFEIRIDRLVDKWSGSIELGVTTHNPNTLDFPATMTNMRSGTIMMSGCGILTNGKGTRREYGSFNLDDLNEGDRVGMMRKSDSNLHYFINGLDQGVAAQRVPTTVWGVIDLYGMTTKVSIVERDEREEQNLITRRNTRAQQATICPLEEFQYFPYSYDRLTFHSNCGTHAVVINNGRTAHRPNATDDFNNGVVLTARPLKPEELFEIRLDKVVSKWAGSIEVGVTTHSAVDLEFPFTMTNVRSGTWMMTGSGIMHNGTIVLEQYGVNLDRLQVGDRVGVMRKENGALHFYVNGVDQGVAATNIPEKIYGVIDLYGQAAEASIIDANDCGSPDTINSSLSNTTLYSDLRFHPVHGKNVRIVNNGLTAVRPKPLAEFNDAIVFSSRPLRDNELFEICLDCIIDPWIGSVELGVTAIRPDDIDLPTTATDLTRDTWMLSGSSLMENGVTINTNYPCDLDALRSGVRLGVMRTADKNLEFYKDGVAQGVACTISHPNVYAVVDLYGQCAQVSLACVSPSAPPLIDNCAPSDLSLALPTNNAGIQQPLPHDLHRFSEIHGNGVLISDDGRLAKRGKDLNDCVVFSATPLVAAETFEVSIVSLASHLAGIFSIGVTALTPEECGGHFPDDCCYLIGNELRTKKKTIQLFTPNLNLLGVGDNVGIAKARDGSLKAYINGEELAVSFPPISENVYVVLNLYGASNSVAVVSHSKTATPLEPARLTDGAPTASSSRTLYEFHENHGRNIELMTDKKIARRVASYDQGIVFVHPALEPGAPVEVFVEGMDTRWQSSLIVGVVAGGATDRPNLPINALALKAPCCIVANDWLSYNGVKSRSNSGQMLEELKPNDKVCLTLLENGRLKLAVNDADEEEFPCDFPMGQPIYAVFDLYGRCQQLRIIDRQVVASGSGVVDCEKANLDCREKEGNKLTLQIPSISDSNAPVPCPKISPISPSKLLTCSWRDECEKFKERLLLPERYFIPEPAQCYCINCMKIRTQVGEKDSLLTGWARFTLSNTDKIDKWHTAFYPVKIGTIRTILDRGQPLTQEQLGYGNLIIHNDDDVQIVFYPSLQYCTNYGFKCGGDRTVHFAFQLSVKPNAYSITSDPVEWSTKENGAIALHSLLIKIVPF